MFIPEVGPVMLSEARHLCPASQMLSETRHDKTILCSACAVYVIICHTQAKIPTINRGTTVFRSGLIERRSATQDRHQALSLQCLGFASAGRKEPIFPIQLSQIRPVPFEEAQ